MIVIAGPPGAGKSTLYPVSSFGIACFNADDRGAELNHGRSIGISASIRQSVNQEFQSFVLMAIDSRTSFAIETTLRGELTFEYVRVARQAGFVAEMRFLALVDFEMHLERVKIRADAGGHSASERTLRSIYEASIKNLGRAIREMDSLRVYDNSPIDASHPLVLEARDGEICFVSRDPPRWLEIALRLA
jgi:predicted ABC-type ATPase